MPVVIVFLNAGDGGTPETSKPRNLGFQGGGVGVLGFGGEGRRRRRRGGCRKRGKPLEPAAAAHLGELSVLSG
jgi:hypothetical protein